MKLILRQKQNKSWKELSQAKYSNEAHLQELLNDSPDLIPTQDISEGKSSIKLSVREIGLPGSGSTDIIGLDELGNIYLIETKLAKNPEVKREVIGQILEYASFLWGKTYEEFDALIKGKNGQYISEFFESKKYKDWEEESFRQTIKSNLANGAFTLFIVVDEINDELRRTIEFLNHRLNIEIYALVLRYFKEGDSVEIMIPQVFGSKPVVRTSSATRNSKIWDQGSFFKDAEEYLNVHELKILKNLYEFTNKESSIKFGTGATSGSFAFRSTYQEVPLTIFEIRSTGTIHFYISSILKRGVSKEHVQQLVDDLVKVDESFSAKKDLEHSYSSSQVQILAKGNKLEEFKKAVSTFKNLLN